MSSLTKFDVHVRSIGQKITGKIRNIGRRFLELHFGWFRVWLRSILLSGRLRRPSVELPVAFLGSPGLRKVF
jgi:hypothetical protein